VKKPKKVSIKFKISISFYTSNCLYSQIILQQQDSEVDSGEDFGDALDKVTDDEDDEPEAQETDDSEVAATKKRKVRLQSLKDSLYT
jgi:hypothetical protein